MQGKKSSTFYKILMSRSFFWILISLVLLLFIGLSLLKSLQDINDKKIKSSNLKQTEFSSNLISKK